MMIICVKEEKFEVHRRLGIVEHLQAVMLDL
jgi:hypothetical protein